MNEKKRALFLLFIALLCCSCFSFYRQRTDSSFSHDEHKSSGTTAYREGRYEAAEKDYFAAIRIAESNTSLRNLLIYDLHDLAQVYIAQSRLADAEREYLKALKIAETQPGKNSQDLIRALNDLTEVYLMRRKLSEAKGYNERVVKICGDFTNQTSSAACDLAKTYNKVISAGRIN